MPCIDDFKCFLMTPWNWPCQKKHQGRGSECSHWSNQTLSPGLFMRGGMWKRWVSMMPKSWWTCHIRRSTKGGAVNAPTEATRHWVQGCSWVGRAEEVSAYDAQVLMNWPCQKKHQGRGSERSHQSNQTSSLGLFMRGSVQQVSVNDAQVLMNWPRQRKNRGRGSECSHQSNQTLSLGLFVRGGMQRGWVLVSAHVDSLKS